MSISFAKAQHLIDEFVEDNTVEGRILLELDIDTIDGVISGDSIHSTVCLPHAIVSGDYLIFLGYEMAYVNKFLYYIGAENEGEICAKFGDLTVVEGVSLERVERRVVAE